MKYAKKREKGEYVTKGGVVKLTTITYMIFNSRVGHR